MGIQLYAFFLGIFFCFGLSFWTFKINGWTCHFQSISEIFQLCTVKVLFQKVLIFCYHLWVKFYEFNFFYFQKCINEVMNFESRENNPKRDYHKIKDLPKTVFLQYIWNYFITHLVSPSLTLISSTNAILCCLCHFLTSSRNGPVLPSSSCRWGNRNIKCKTNVTKLIRFL